MPIVNIAGGWYTSGTFWTGAGAVVALLGAVATVWVTFTVGSLRRRLHYGMQPAAPLLAAPDGMRSKLELHYDGLPLANPRVITVQLTSRSRKDIPSDAYNDGQPLRLDVGAPILEILQITSVPETYPLPSVITDGTALAIGPSLIGKRHNIMITLLTDGAKPSLSCRSPLIDVQVTQRAPEYYSNRRQWIALTAISVIAALAVISILNEYVFPRTGGFADTIVAPKQTGGFTRSPSLEKQINVETLSRNVMEASEGQAANLVSAVYQEDTVTVGGDPQIFMFVGGNLSAADPNASIVNFEQSYPSATLVPAGKLGGDAVCVEARENGEDMAMCTWFDSDSFGALVSPTMTTAKLASLLGKVRPSLELYAK